MLGNHLKIARKLKGLSQEELAEKMFTTKQNISSYESGKTLCPLQTLITLSSILDIDINIYNGKCDISYTDELGQKLVFDLDIPPEEVSRNVKDKSFSLNTLVNTLKERFKFKVNSSNTLIKINLFDLGTMNYDISPLSELTHVSCKDYTYISNDILISYCEFISKKTPNKVIDLLNEVYKSTGISLECDEFDAIYLIDVNGVKWTFNAVTFLDILFISHFNLFELDYIKELPVKPFCNYIQFINPEYFKTYNLSKKAKNSFEFLTSNGVIPCKDMLVLLEEVHSIINRYNLVAKEILEPALVSKLKQDFNNTILKILDVESIFGMGLNVIIEDVLDFAKTTEFPAKSILNAVPDLLKQICRLTAIDISNHCNGIRFSIALGLVKINVLNELTSLNKIKLKPIDDFEIKFICQELNKESSSIAELYRSTTLDEFLNTYSTIDSYYIHLIKESIKNINPEDTYILDKLLKKCK